MIKVKAFSVPPKLAIIQVGDREDSTAYIRAKKTFADKLGIGEVHIQLPENTFEKDLLDEIKKCNEDADITGIILQLPIPARINRDIAVDAIDPAKDVDRITSTNVKLWQENKGLLPATSRGIKELLKYYDISLSGKKVTVIGRSALVGTPIAAMCRNEGAVVTVCHSKTIDIKKETLGADIVISAVGKPALVGREYVREGQVVIDVGISRGEDGKLHGDADFDAIKDVVSAITPVPGGVGPMTVFALFENLVDISS
jgi:methylenetetrahydrofolate dehydrogenase (NADP+)/methenyltetrahydrofolate cyclohydrolase